MDHNFENQTPENTPETNTVPEENSVTEAKESEAATDTNAAEKENCYTDPNEGVVYEEAVKSQEPAGTTGSYTYGAPHTGTSQQNSGQAQQNNSYAYGNHADSSYNSSNYGNNADSNRTNGGYNSSNYGNNMGYQSAPEYQSEGMDTSPLSMGEWILTLLVSMVPCIGLIFYFIWAFDRNGNINRRNYCRAALIMQLIGFAICVIFVGLVMVAGVSSYGYMY